MVTKVQGNARETATSGSTITITQTSTPTNGNMNILTVGIFDSPSPPTVSSISQTGVTWTLAVKKTQGNEDSEIWVGVIGSGASTSITINLSASLGSTYGVGIADVCEWSGVTSTVDKTKPNYNNGGTAVDSGTTDPTTYADELWIASLYAATSGGALTETNQTNGFTLLDGANSISKNGIYHVEGYTYKIVSSTGQANSGVSVNHNSQWAGCIATFKASGTIIVPRDERYAGNGSKQTPIYWTPGADTIMQVESNVPSYLEKSAVIENLIIDGTGSTNATGILLENGYNCYIRNVTIMNCDIGIKIRITGSNWSHANRFEHIRMINVKTGILFTGTSTNKDFSHTIIDDVGISLTGDSNSIGIKVGEPNGNLYSAFIKATVWLGSTSGKGMEVNGQLKFSLVNLEVEEDTTYSGRGVYITSGATVYDNQSFLLTALGLDADKKVMNYGTYDGGITVLPP